MCEESENKLRQVISSSFLFMSTYFHGSLIFCEKLFLLSHQRKLFYRKFQKVRRNLTFDFFNLSPKKSYLQIIPKDFREKAKEAQHLQLQLPPSTTGPGPLLDYHHHSRRTCTTTAAAGKPLTPPTPDHNSHLHHYPCRTTITTSTTPRRCRTSTTTVEGLY